MSISQCPQHTPMNSKKPNFFKVLLPNFSNHLQLPHTFVKKHMSKDDMKALKATLLSPDGKTWKVCIHKNGQNIHLSGAQWHACVEALNLKLGYFLIFSYEGNMGFSFRVFDLSTCEKAYPPSLAPVSKEEKAAVMRTNECQDGHSFEIVGQGFGPITSCCKHCKCTRFEASVSHTNMCYHYMGVPAPFMELSGLSKTQESLNLVNAEGHSWTVRLGHFVVTSARGYRTRTRILGFTQFLLDNSLDLGDRIAFDVEAGVKNMMHVQVVKV